MRPVVGLTGGIACGKSTVAAQLAELGVPIVDADALAREVVAPGTPGLAAIVERFGSDVLLADGALDRKKLGERVFSDPDARRALNAITHPRIAAAGLEKLRALAEHPAPYRVYEAALLVENGMAKAFAALVVVTVDEATQLARLMARDGSTESEARARIASQLPLAKKIEVADHVIDNSGAPEATRAQVRALHDALVARFGGGA
ncbi:MAG: dephospho-CoA kinase [Myxococcota bacterium]|jgi:dephospho-CoA kinase|nr:dephospho-CoA kinase [Myxococcota bacterium]